MEAQFENMDGCTIYNLKQNWIYNEFNNRYKAESAGYSRQMQIDAQVRNEADIKFGTNSELMSK